MIKKSLITCLFLFNFFTYGQSDLEKDFLQAVFFDDIAIMQAALDEHVNIDAVNEDGLTALMIATYYGYYDTVALLCQSGAMIDVQNNEGYTALMYAAGQGWTDIIILLLNYEADVNLRSLNGWTALLFAVAYDQCDQCQAVICLIDAGANLDAQDDEGYTGLMIASNFNLESIVELLCKAGADLHIVDHHGYTALMYAQEADHDKIIELLNYYDDKIV